jgi:hypothetical protein
MTSTIGSSSSFRRRGLRRVVDMQVGPPNIPDEEWSDPTPRPAARLAAIGPAVTY